MELIAELSYLMNCDDYVYDNEDVLICVESRIFNKKGNTDQSEFDTFWNAMVCVVDMYSSGAHVLRHTEGGNLETKINISYVPSINSSKPLLNYFKSKGRRRVNTLNSCTAHG